MIRTHRFRQNFRRCLAALVACGFFASSAHAELITVGPDPDCTTGSLVAALLLARLNGTDFDEIRVMQGTYSNLALSSTGISYSLTGGYNHCRLGAQALGRSNLVGNFVDPVLRITGAESSYHNVTLSHLNISNGGNLASGVHGGGVDATNLRLVLEETTVLNNRATRGGGISMRRNGNAVSVILELQRNVSVLGNAANYGGGIYAAHASVRIRPDGTEVAANVAAEGTGGGLHLEFSDLSVGSFGLPETSNTAKGLVIRDNLTSYGGGGLFAESGLIDLRETAFLRNMTHARSGGAILIRRGQLQVGRDSSGLAVQCPAGVACSRFENNVAGFDCPRDDGDGGAIALYDTRAFVQQTLFSGNCGAYGAVLTAFGTVSPQPAIDIEGIVTRNNVSRAGFRSFETAGETPVRIRYSTLTGDFSREFVEGGQIDRLVPPLIPTPANANRYIRTSILQTAMPSGWSIGFADCNLTSVSDWAGMFRDGLNGDFRLAATAPAIDACSAAVAPTETLDIERKPRCTDSPAHANGGGHCDIGAFEYDDDPFGYGFGNDFE